MEHVTEALKQAETDLATTREELRMARELVASLEADAKGIEIEIVGLRSYAKRHGLTGDGTAETPGTPLRRIAADGFGEVVSLHGDTGAAPMVGLSEILTMSRNDAVATVMAQAPGPIDRNAIHSECALAGRDDSLDDISLSLSGLKRAGRVEKLGRGLWRLAEDTSATGS
ncbi:MAG: hypothetical protein AAF567_21045 [Actinomycetota bacterium]